MKVTTVISNEFDGIDDGYLDINEGYLEVSTGEVTVSGGNWNYGP